MRAILINPKYTGRQVWARQRNDRGGTAVRGWNDREDWVISTDPAHPALVSETDFVGAQPGHRHTSPYHRRQPDPASSAGGHVYALTGFVFCGLCGRRLEPHWATVRPAYRCRHGSRYSNPSAAQRQPDLYVREDHLLTALTHAATDDPTLEWAKGKRRNAMATLLRRHQVAIVIDRTEWTIEWPDGHVSLWPSASLPATAIPAQRRPRL